MLMWQVKPGRFVRDAKGRVIAKPGERLPYDHADALACASAVLAVRVEDDPEPPKVEAAIVFDDDEPEDEDDEDGE